MDLSTPSSSLVTHLLSFSLIYLFVLSLCHDHTSSPTSTGISVVNPVIEVTPVPMSGYFMNVRSKDDLSCERVKVSGISRLGISCIANSVRITVAPSVVIPERLHDKIQVCFHVNASRAMCECNQGEWKNIYKGIWTSSMSPYEERFVDVKFIGRISGSVTVSIEEDLQHWRLFFLAFGFLMILLAPIVSSWVPFYYSSSMVIGVLLVVIILLFQAMKILPTGRKSTFYLTIYGSVFGAGSFLLLHFCTMINSILINFGLNEEMHYLVSVFALVMIVLAGAGLGYWIVRKYIISEDGCVNHGVAQFVKWAMRIFGATFILQSSVDTPMAIGALASCWTICIAVHSAKQILQRSRSPWHWKNKTAVSRHSRTEFLSRNPRSCKKGTLGTPRSRSSPMFNNSPVQGLVSPTYKGVTKSDLADHYSTFHKTPTRQRFTKREWEEFTEESTRKAMSKLASTPEFTEWVIENASRINLHSDDSSPESYAYSGDDTASLSRQQD